MERTYIAIDLKSFYASVECAERKLNPLNTNLVVADKSRTEKTICLAVSPSLKQYGIPGRARLFEVIQAVKKINRIRLAKAPNHKFKGKSYFDHELRNDSSLELDFIIATPQMQHYLNVSASIYKTYLDYVSSDDIHVYSIDEVFIDVTGYLKTYNTTPHDLARKMIQDVLKKTGITATAGIGSNMYLAKVAMDIVAKHIPADKDGVRIAELNERSYREKLWDHTPLRDFWRVGAGYTRRLEKLGLFTMGDIARQSLEDEDVLYKEFGINAELLIDHAWGYEPTTMEDIKSYKPSFNSLSSGQVLSEPYDYERSKLIVKEMCELLILDMVDKHLVTNQMALSIGYDISDLKGFDGETKDDWYGREVPKGAHGSINLGEFTNSRTLIMKKMDALFEKLYNKGLHMRRVYVVATNILDEEVAEKESKGYEQLCLFSDYEEQKEKKKEKEEFLKKEKDLQESIIKIQKKYGKNSVLKAMNLKEGGTTIERNKQIGGHKA